jgi:hypothetical protein
MSKEIVTPDQETINQQVREAVELQDIRNREGQVVGQKFVLFKTPLDKILKSHGVPVQVLKVGHAIEDMMVNSMALILAEDVTKKAEEGKAAGIKPEELKKLKSFGKIATGHGNIKMVGNAYVEHPNPQNPQAGKLKTALMVTARVAGAHNLRHIQDTEYAARMRKALNMGK